MYGQSELRHSKRMLFRTYNRCKLPCQNDTPKNTIKDLISISTYLSSDVAITSLKMRLSKLTSNVEYRGAEENAPKSLSLHFSHAPILTSIQ